MIAITRTTNHQRRLARSGGVLALDPPRHSDQPVSVLSPGKHVVGSAPSCSIQIPSDGVQPCHAMILVGDQKILLKAMDSKTWVNDCAVSETVLRPGDTVSIGPMTFLVRFATPDEILESDRLAVDDSEKASERVSADRSISMAMWGARTSVSDPEPESHSESGSETSLIPEHQTEVSPVLVEPLEQIETLNSIDFSTPTADEVSELIGAAEVVEHPAPVTEIAATDEVSIAHESDSELQIVQQEVAALSDKSADFHATSGSARIAAEHQRLMVREETLKQLSVELSRQSLRLRDRNAQIVEREAALELKHARLAADNERLVAAAQSTRQELADEYASQLALWKEWDAAYQRTTSDLKSQLETVELRRASIQVENERLTSERAEIQRLQTEHDEQRRAIAGERVQATRELGELHSQRAAFETERRQMLAEVQERESQIVSERRALAVAQDELLAVRQQIEHDRTLFAAERSAESLRREQEIKEHTVARTRLHEEDSALHSLRFDLESLRRSIEEERATLHRERDEFEATRTEVNQLRSQLDQAQLDLILTRQAEEEKQAEIDLATKNALRRQQDLEQWQQTLEAQQQHLEAFRSDILREQQEMIDARSELSRAIAPTNMNPASESAGAPFGHLASEENRSTVNLAVDHLLGIYGVNPAESTISTKAELYPFPHGGPELGSLSIESLAPVPPPIPSEEWSTTSTVEHPRTSDLERPLLRGENETPHEFGQFTGTSEIDVASEVPSSLDEASFRYGQAWTPIGQVSTSVAHSRFESSTALIDEQSMQSADEAIQEVSQRFGYEDDFGNQSRELLPQHDLPIELDQFAKDQGEPASIGESPVVDTPMISLKTGLVNEAGENSIESLRAQLAQMFDLPSDEGSLDRSSLSADTSTIDSDESANGQVCDDSTDHASTESFPAESSEIESSSPLDALDAADQAVQLLADSTASGSDIVSTDIEDEVEEETPWTRRLRELSAVAESGTTKPATPPPAPVATPPASTESGDVDDDEFSVEAQLARLLGRPMHRASESGPAIVPLAQIPSDKGNFSQGAASDGKAPSDNPLPDRSHLADAPRHKQNKDTVREEVQSFRAVAQMSARKALAKHSRNNLKNEFYLASGLTSACAVATVWYVGSWLYGTENEVWKGITCALTTLLSGQKLLRSRSQLKLLQISHPAPSRGNRPTETSASEPESASSSPDVVTTEVTND